MIALECVGSPHLMLMEGEGMLLMRDHDPELRAEIQAAADAAGIGLWRGLRLGAGATDALPALRAGYRTACIAACDRYKAPANYHWPSDVPENLDWNTIDGAADVLDSLIRGLAAQARLEQRRQQRRGPFVDPRRLAFARTGDVQRAAGREPSEQLPRVLGSRLRRGRVDRRQLASQLHRRRPAPAPCRLTRPRRS